MKLYNKQKKKYKKKKNKKKKKKKNKKRKEKKEKGEILNLNIILKYIPQIAKNDFLLDNAED